MIKRISQLALVFSFVLILSGSSFAQTNTPTESPSPSETVQESQIEKIKDLVASKVAELKLVDKRGILGEVKSVSNTQVTVVDHKGETRQIDIDELTKFEGEDEDSFGISDVEEGDFLSFVGLYNKDTKRLLARFISQAENVPENIQSLVVEKDNKNFTAKILTSDGKEKTVDIETSTKTFSFEDGKTTKSGFSQIEDGERIIVVGFEDPEDDSLINASRIIHFSSIPPSSSLLKLLVENDEEIPASTGAAKIQPIVDDEDEES